MIAVNMRIMRYFQSKDLYIDVIIKLFRVTR